MKHSFTWAGISSANFGILVSGVDTYNAADRDFKTEQIPGKNGSEYLDNGRLDNVSVVYHCTILTGCKAKAPAIRAWLSKAGYGRLEDTYDTTHYRTAYVAQGVSFELLGLDCATFDVEFSARPERWIKQDAMIYNLDADADLQVIQAGCTASEKGYPVISLTTATPVQVCIAPPASSGEEPYNISVEATGAITINCKSYEAYKSGSRITSQITVTDDRWPVLYPGITTITISGTCTAVTIDSGGYDL